MEGSLKKLELNDRTETWQTYTFKEEGDKVTFYNPNPRETQFIRDFLVNQINQIFKGTNDDKLQPKEIIQLREINSVQVRNSHSSIISQLNLSQYFQHEKHFTNYHFLNSFIFSLNYSLDKFRFSVIQFSCLFV